MNEFVYNDKRFVLYVSSVISQDMKMMNKLRDEQRNFFFLPPPLPYYITSKTMPYNDLTSSCICLIKIVFLICSYILLDSKLHRRVSVRQMH